MIDWGIGHYERTAEQLRPAAAAVVDEAAPLFTEDVVDVGCGTGNAALLAAERGARVTGVDPAERLLEVARADAAARRLKAEFIRGEAATIPLPDDAADVVISVFGVIFAEDAEAAGAELARVTARRGRIVLSAWIPEGPISAIGRAAREALAEAGVPPGPPPFAWHDADALEGLFGPLGFDVSLRERTQVFSAPSITAYVEREFHDHPLWLAGRAVLEPQGGVDPLLERCRAILHEGNEADGDGFRVTSRYVIATMTR